MIKICIVAEYMYCGGTEKSLLSLLNFLDKTKYDVTLLLMKKKGVLMEQIPCWVKVDEIPLPKDETDDLLVGRTVALINALKNAHFLSAFRKVIRAIKILMFSKSDTEKRLRYYQSIDNKLSNYEKEFDVVIDYMGYGLFNTFYAAKKIKAKVKLSWVHFEPEAAIPDFYVFESILNEYNHIMCVSGSSLQQVKKMMPNLADKCHVFYNIVDQRSLYDLSKEKIIKPDGAISILSVGRLDYPKGFDIGIGVIEKLCKDGYNIKWQIIGEGWQRTELELKIAECIYAKSSIMLLGQIINPYPYFAACDIFFMPSRHDGYGIVLAEARAFCKPSVVTNFAGAKEQLKDEITGLISNCDEESLYRALKRLLDDCQLRNKLSNALADEKETQEKQIEYLENIFNVE